MDMRGSEELTERDSHCSPSAEICCLRTEAKAGKWKGNFEGFKNSKRLT